MTQQSCLGSKPLLAETSGNLFSPAPGIGCILWGTGGARRTGNVCSSSSRCAAPGCPVSPARQNSLAPAGQLLQHRGCPEFSACDRLTAPGLERWSGGKDAESGAARPCSHPAHTWPGLTQLLLAAGEASASLCCFPASCSEPAGEPDTQQMFSLS